MTLSERPRLSTLTVRLSVVLIFLGGLLLATGLGDGSTLGTALFVGGMMFVWTTVLPRISALAPIGVFFASHAAAAGAYWGALSLADRWTPVLGDTSEQIDNARWLFFCAVAAGTTVLLGGMALERAVTRGGDRARRALTVALAATVVLTAALVGAAIDDAPTPFERLRAAPVVAHVARGQRVTREPFAIYRASDGSFEPLHVGNLDWLVSNGPRALDHYQSDAPNLCRAIPPDAAIEIRRLGDRLVLTAEGELDRSNVFVAEGCAYDARTLARVELRTADLERPLATSDHIGAIVLGALAVALVQLAIAAAALTRHARLHGARDAVADGAGWVTLADGTRAKADAPSAGAVLVAVSAPERADYRENAAPSARVVAPGSRAEADERMHRATCIALVGAISALAAVALPLAGTILADLVVPL